MNQKANTSAASFGAILGAAMEESEKPFCMLEHQVSSQFHQAGEIQFINKESVDLGRDPVCAVRFDDSFSTVSRRHASITKAGEQWKIVQVSTTNPTFVNGQKVVKEQILQNGDEIRLAGGGPRLKFIIPTGKRQEKSDIRLSRRLSLFRRQALRPYRTAIIALSITLLLVIGGLVVWNYLQPGAASRKNEQAIAKCEKYVYFIRSSRFECVSPNGETFDDILEENVLMGTGFLLNDGRFVTARHVVEPWFFSSYDEDSYEMSMLNYIANNGGKVRFHFTAYSSSGDRMTFTSDQFICNRQTDETETDEDGDKMITAQLNHTDWAYVQTSKTSGLPFDANLSLRLERGTALTVLGFPFGLGAQPPYTTITPQLSTGMTTANGLTNNVILTANTSYEKGNSGGPVFSQDPSGNLTVIGIVSAGLGRSTGFIVPISSLPP